MSTKKTANKVARNSAKAAVVNGRHSLAKARELAKAITTEAKGNGKAAHTVDAKAAKAISKVAPATQRFDYTQRVVANPKHPMHKGFFGVVQAIAKKPITLGDLASKVQQQVKLTSAKSPAFVCRVRTRHAFTRLGILQAAK